MLRIFNPLCAVLFKAVHRYGSTRRVTQTLTCFYDWSSVMVGQELLSLAALANAACPRTVRTPANDKGTFVYPERELWRSSRNHARTGGSVPTDIHQNS